jgi:hypothetical protein
MLVTTSVGLIDTRAVGVRAAGRLSRDGSRCAQNGQIGRVLGPPVLNRPRWDHCRARSSPCEYLVLTRRYVITTLVLALVYGITGDASRDDKSSLPKPASSPIRWTVLPETAHVNSPLPVKWAPLVCPNAGMALVTSTAAKAAASVNWGRLR